MIIYIAADHRGVYLKETLKKALKKDGYEIMDAGNPEPSPDDDYPDFAAAVAEKVSGTQSGDVRGIVICGSGFGVDIAANKFKGVRSALAMSPEHIRAGRNDDDVNVLSLASNFITPEGALDITRMFLATPFKAENRYVRRLDEIKKIEEKK
jgi:ribose 5-phosphate isomerase B